MRRVALLLLAVFFVSTAALLATRAQAEMTPLAVAAWRLGLASILFGGWSLAVKTPQIPLTRTQKTRLILAGICLAGHFWAWFAALGETSVARATLLVCTTPLWTTLGGLFFRRRVSPSFWLALALAAVGMILTTSAARETATILTRRGDALAIFGGVCFAVYLLLLENLHLQIPPRRQVTVAYSVAAVFLWAILLTRGVPRFSYSPAVWLAIFGMTLGPQMVGHTLLNASLRFFSPSVIALATLLEPIVAATLAFFLLGQTLTAGQIFGGILTISALALAIGPSKSVAEAVG